MKWELTDAARKRIEKRVTELRKGDPEGDKYMYHPWRLVLDAMKPEDYARVRDKAEQLVKLWIREGVFAHLCSQCLEDYCRERRELREAGENFMRGIRQMENLL